MNIPPTDNTPWHRRLLLAALTGLVSSLISTGVHTVLDAIPHR
jgi:hypothetical protein